MDVPNLNNLKETLDGWQTGKFTTYSAEEKAIYAQGVEDGQYKVYAQIWNGAWAAFLWAIIPILIVFFGLHFLNSLPIGAIAAGLYYLALVFMVNDLKKQLEAIDEKKATHRKVLKELSK